MKNKIKRLFVMGTLIWFFIWGTGNLLAYLIFNQTATITETLFSTVVFYGLVGVL